MKTRVHPGQTIEEVRALSMELFNDIAHLSRCTVEVEYYTDADNGKYVLIPFDCTLIKVYCLLHGTITNENVLTIEDPDGTDMADTLTILAAGVDGSLYSADISTNNKIAEGEIITIDSDTAGDNIKTTITLVCERSL